MLTKGDFHIHSNASDGDLSPLEIVKEAKKRGIDTIAISDHNTTDGIKEATKAGRKYGVSVVPAVEISSRYKNKQVHILGYFRNNKYKDSEFQEILKLIRAHKARKARNISKEFMLGTSKYYLSSEEVINLLRRYDAAVVLAHPVRINKKYFSEIINLSFDGIEAKYASHSYMDTFYFMAISLSHFSFYTAGSDFHTNKIKSEKHSFIGKSHLNKSEIQTFLKKSGALLLK